MRKQLIVLLLFLVAMVSFADATKYQIKDIEIINNREIPSEVILNELHLKKGDSYVTENMVNDYKKLKDLKYVDDVAIYPTPFDNGIKLVIDITENPNAKKLLQEKGIIPNSEMEKVDKNLIVNNVEIVGDHHIPMAQLKALVPLTAGSYFSKTKVIEGHKNLIESGYFRDVIPEVVGAGKGVKVIYTVYENPIINGIHIIGNNVYPTADLLKVIQTKPGEIFNINTIRGDRDRILQLYQDGGYVLADVSDIGLNNKGELEIYISEGIIRNIEIKKMVTKQKGGRRRATDDVLKTKKYVIERELEIKDGQVFNSQNYDETVDNLMRLGIFKNVKYEVRGIPGDPDGRDIILYLDEDRTAVLQGAISYGSEIGLLGSLSLKDTNWQGRGQELGVSFEKSNKDYSNFSIDFYDPWIKDTDRVSWGWSLYKTTYEDGDSSIFNRVDTYGGKIDIGKGITKNVRLGLGTKLEYVTEKSNMSDFIKGPDGNYYWKNKNYWVNQNTPRKAEGLNDKYYVWSLFPSISYDTRNNYWNPTKGLYSKLQLEVGYANGYKGGTFGNVTGEVRTYHRGFFKNNTFAYKAVAGIMTKDTKEGQRFWVGGGNTLRGYDGGYFKGTKKVVASIENRTQINDILGFVLFADAGRAWDYDGRDLSYDTLSRNKAKFPSNIATSAGVGLRLNTPIGPLRFDFGWPVGDKNQKGMQFYFNMGQSF